MIRLRELADTRVDVCLFTRKMINGKWAKPKRRGRPIIFQRMSTADVWDVIVTAARDRLFRIEPRPRKTKVRSKS